LLRGTSSEHTHKHRNAANCSHQKEDYQLHKKKQKPVMPPGCVHHTQSAQKRKNSQINLIN